jgi:hypothetical protein
MQDPRFNDLGEMREMYRRLRHSARHTRPLDPIQPASWASRRRSKHRLGVLGLGAGVGVASSGEEHVPGLGSPTPVAKALTAALVWDSVPGLALSSREGDAGEFASTGEAGN